MSFLDSLENNLKTLESREDAGAGDARKRESDQKNAKAAAPWAERLKNGQFSKDLMQQATRAGFDLRTKVHFAWIGTTLRLDARGERLELRPTPSGIEAVMLSGGREVRRRVLRDDERPDALLSEWMPLVAERKRLDDEAAKSAAVSEE